MSEFYDDMRDVASELFTEFKQGSIAYIDIVLGVGGTPDNPAPPTEVSRPIDAASRGISYKYVRMGLASATDIQVSFAAPIGWEPKLGGFVAINNHRYKVTQVIAKPQAEPVAYTLILQK